MKMSTWHRRRAPRIARSGTYVAAPVGVKNPGMACSIMMVIIGAGLLHDPDSGNMTSTIAYNDYCIYYDPCLNNIIWLGIYKNFMIFKCNI